MTQDTTNPSSTGTAPNRIQYLETTDAYNKWAKVYDTDNNFLQALDTLEMQTLLPHFLHLLGNTFGPDPTKLIDLGCGTGRNTLLLARLASPETEIVGLDASSGMLDVARETIEGNSRVSLEIFDLLQESMDVPVGSTRAAGIISTLVLEHVPPRRFFEAAEKMLRPGGCLLVTNMHSDMGAISQAGFVDVETGVKIRPVSYKHEIGDVVAVAEEVGFRVEWLDGEGVRERMVDERLAGVLGPRAKKWIGVVVWFGVCFRKVME
ncbi:S-adenosyl-L-methionine-dependent methyltransferase [Aspergillus sclerotioniger CBS 115572]|uniref:S-adenosyl-L-methionine-dependent methyltransferase n=1 Tax=Aspergillus sclerotioniger CBS 115572 TaxID=1450535 RepID=A0A317X8A3_9EURO|nr:S-adenosyl-L-methionine-dependent methyltransferase [Aspergillus sclerotioniger CBS 115572]PWY94823.1 S-adenosyl-L-methionine-dependent methyltransferase [Aspergillus sclerotioniger CBS 115572]